MAGAQERIGVRLNQALYNHATKRANAQFGGVITDYIKDLIRKDMTEIPTDPAEWLELVNNQIREVQTSMQKLLKVKQKLTKQIVGEKNPPGP
jgi:hypothetical protein